MRLAWIACLAALSAAAASRPMQDRPLQADPIVRLLADLESAIEAGADDLGGLVAALPDAHADVLRRAAGGGPGARAVIRERTRRPLGSDHEVVADVFVSRGRTGRLATWQVLTRPAAGSDRHEIVGLHELAAVDRLLRLTLDTTRQFTADGLTFRATDFVLRMTSGTAFVAESPDGVTGVVLRGRGDVQFTPPDAAEQGQLRIFGGRPDLFAPIDMAFLRLDPDEFAERFGRPALTPVRLDAAEVRRAEALFDEFAPRSYNVDLRDLADERWSFEPGLGHTLAEFRTRRWGWLTYARSPIEAEDVQLFDRGRSRTISVYASAARQQGRGRFYSEDATVPYDVVHHDLDVRFDPERAWVAGRSTLRVRVRADSLSTLTFRLAAPLVVSSVTSPDFGRLLALRLVGQNHVIVTLPAVVRRGTELLFDVVYGGRLPPQGIEREALAPQRSSQDPLESIPLTPEPRFLYSSRAYWYPQSTVSDFATATMRLAVPAGFQLVASGSVRDSALVPANPPDGRGEGRHDRVVRYEVDRPARYLSCIISRFVPIARTVAPVPAVAPPARAAPDAGAVPAAVAIEVVSTPRMTRRNRDVAPRVADILRFYAGFVGEAPYPDFTLAALDDLLPGGHSPPFFAIWHQPLPMAPLSWASDPVAFDDHPHFFLAHEIAHQWWGQAVGWKNYHEQWLSEGFAQYFAAMYTGADRGPDALRGLLSRMRASAVTLSAKGPIHLGYRLGHLENDGRIFRGLVYNKSAVVLHMLRRLIGDEAFQRGVGRLYRQARFDKAGTGDVIAAFEAASGRPLGRFFDGWILGAGLPRLRITTRSEADALVIRVEQVGPVFELPFTVGIQYADGRTEEVVLILATPVTERTVPLTGRLRRVVTRDELAPVEYDR